MIEIVQMQHAHVPEVAAIEAQCFSTPWSEDSIRSEVENSLSLWLVALEQGAVVGFVGSQTVLGEADIMNVAVAPQMRNQGIAQQLLRTLEARLRAHRVTSITLEVRPTNAPAVRLYRAEGYVVAGRRKNYYVNPDEDAWILRKECKL